MMVGKVGARGYLGVVVFAVRRGCVWHSCVSGRWGAR